MINNLSLHFRVLADIYQPHSSPQCITPTTPTSPSLPIPIPSYAQISHAYSDSPQQVSLPLPVEGFNGFHSMFPAFHAQHGSNGGAPVSPLSHHSELDAGSDVDMAQMPSGSPSQVFKSRKGNYNFCSTYTRSRPETCLFSNKTVVYIS